MMSMLWSSGVRHYVDHSPITQPCEKVRTYTKHFNVFPQVFLLLPVYLTE